MLVYQAIKSEFMADVEGGVIVDNICDAFIRRVQHPGASEVRSWQNSMQFMYAALNTERIPDDCGIAIEFGVPYTSSRIDFLITGRDDDASESAVIVELKQWDKVATVPGKDAMVRTFLGGRERETVHPSYQAWSYARMIEDYNEAVRDAQVSLLPCAYLHNYSLSGPGDPILDPMYDDYVTKAPVFTRTDLERLRDFICRRIKVGDDGSVMFTICLLYTSPSPRD